MGKSEEIMEIVYFCKTNNLGQYRQILREVVENLTQCMKQQINFPIPNCAN